jgi:DNA primase large subunit
VSFLGLNLSERYIFTDLVSHFKQLEAAHLNDDKLPVLSMLMKLAEEQSENMAKLEEKQGISHAILSEQMMELTKMVKNLMKQQGESMSKLEEKQAKDHGKMGQLASQNGMLIKQVEEQAKMMEKLLEVQMKQQGQVERFLMDKLEWQK